MGMLAGQQAIVTGGAGGIGRATVQRMVEEGASVAIIDNDTDTLAATTAELGLPGFAADVSDPQACTQAIQDAAAALGGLTVLFNNAGVGNAMPLHRYPDAEWARLVGVNLTGTFHGIRAGRPAHARARRQHREPRVGEWGATDSLRRSVLGGEGRRDLVDDGRGIGIRAEHPRELRVAGHRRDEPHRDGAARRDDACRGGSGDPAGRVWVRRSTSRTSSCFSRRRSRRT